MGNANGHVSDRRKSLSGSIGGSSSATSSVPSNDTNPYSAHNANVGTAIHQPLGNVNGIKIFNVDRVSKIYNSKF